MTSHELAKLLLEQEDVMVVTNGYEGGWCEINKIKSGELHLDQNEKGSYFGPHEEAYSNKLDKVKCIFIPRNNGEKSDYS